MATLANIQVGAEPIEGYKLLERIGSGGFGEVWKTTAPGGLNKALKIVYGDLSDPRAQRELRSLEKMREVRHPFLMSIERLEVKENQVLIIMELAERSLIERFNECRSKGLKGIPRNELLIYLHDVADALDYMNENYGLLHLDIKPQNILIVGGRAKLGDFGLVKSFTNAMESSVGGFTPVYASPEAFDGKVGRESDQYSLAIVYQELLTGKRPFPGQTTMQLTIQHLNCPPLLDPLPVHDQPVLARALAKVPSLRYATSKELVEALQKAHASPLPETEDKEPRFSIKIGSTTSSPRVLLTGDDVVETRSVARGVEPELETPVDLKNLGDDFFSTTKLRPTIVIGLGGVGGAALRRLRRGLSERFGMIETIPIIRMLHLDVDRRVARSDAPIDSNLVEDHLNLPLRRADEYRGQAKELTKWLDRNYLYGIPLSGAPEGIRPLGRLALLDNIPVLRERLQRLFKAVLSTNAIENTRINTELEVVADHPRVVIVSSISGGSGSGMIVDLAYMIRQCLAEAKVKDFDLLGVLAHVTPVNPQEKFRSRANALATLNELYHFSRNDRPFMGDPGNGVASFSATTPPFTDIYFQHIGEDLTNDQFDSVARKLERYVLFELSTPASAFLPRYRKASASPQRKGVPTARSFGLNWMSIPRQSLAKLTAMSFCHHLIQKWRHGHGSVSPQHVRNENNRFISSLKLDSGLIDVLEQATLGLLGLNSASDFSVFWTPNSPLLSTNFTWGEIAKPVETLKGKESFASLVANMDAVFGPIRDRSNLSESNLYRGSLYRATERKATELSGAAIEWIVSFIENPRGRLAFAENVLNDLSTLLIELSKITEQQWELVAADCVSQRSALLAADEQSSVRFRWPLRSRGQVTQQERDAMLRNYCLLRIRESTISGGLRVQKAVHRTLVKLGEEIVTARRNLGAVAEGFPDCLAPYIKRWGNVRQPLRLANLLQRADSIEEVAAQILQSIFPEAVQEFDETFQSTLLNFAGGLWPAVNGVGDLAPNVRQMMIIKTQTAMQEALADIDVSGLLLESCSTPTELTETLNSMIELAKSDAVSTDARLHHVLAVPHGPTGAEILDKLRVLCEEQSSSGINGGSDVCICTEVSGLAFQSVAQAFLGSPSKYETAARRVMTRIDVAWVPFRVKE